MKTAYDTKKVLYLDCVDCLSLFFTMLEIRRYSEIYYFNITAPAKYVLKCLAQNSRIKYFDFMLSDLRTEKGENLFEKIYVNDLGNLCSKIRLEMLEKSALVKSVGELFGPQKVMIFFERSTYIKLMDMIVFMNVARWHLDNHSERALIVPEFSVEKSAFFPVLKEFAREKYGLQVVPSFSIRTRVRNLVLLGWNLLVFVKMLLISVINGSKRSCISSTKKKIDLPKVAAAYRYCGINFDPVRRSDFPWLLFSGIPFQQVMIYFDSSRALEKNDVDKIRENGIGCVARSRNAMISNSMSLYGPTYTVAKESVKIFKKLIPCMITEMLSSRSSLFFCIIPQIIRFIKQYVKAYDFYLANNIKIAVDPDNSNPYLIAERIGLKNAGGVSVNYQMSNWSIPNMNIGSSADIIFLFGSYSYSILRKSSSDNEVIIFSGFISDCSFKKVKQNAAMLRQSLANNGARFVVCYFDEDSSDDRLSLIPISKCEYVYEKLLKWVISNKEVGLICSPKRPGSLFDKILKVSWLVEKAQSTGRCLFMKGNNRTYNWPSEAAQAADVAVGLLGTTTVLESFLSGVRAVYLDLEHMYFFPEHKLRKGSIVFEDVDSLISAIDRYRSNREGFDEFGNISLVSDLVKAKDSFCDGRAGERMGRYIKWLLDGFNEGMLREEAIASASTRYAKEWGKDKIINKGSDDSVAQGDVINNAQIYAKR